MGGGGGGSGGWSQARVLDSKAFFTILKTQSFDLNKY